MGCDGGTIPRRDELVRTRKPPEKADKEAETAAKWKYCAITQLELKSPIVCCELGRLYNKDAVIEYLLDKSTVTNDVATHIRSLRDVVHLQLTPNKGKADGDDDVKGDEYVQGQSAKYVCPVTGLEINGKYRFIVIRGCGCVLSERSMKEIKSELCHKCGRKYDADEVIILNGSEEEVNQLKLRMDSSRVKEKQDKKAKKVEKKRKLQAEASGTATPPLQKKVKQDVNGQASTSSGTLPKVKVGTAVKATVDAVEDKLKQLAGNPNASDAYKSLFTSHDSCKNQPRAHWVTYNPLYY